MRDFSDRSSASSSAGIPQSKKRLGGYLVEAGLLTPAQVDVALNDQKLTGMRFGEILAARGWVKQQTIEYLMHKVVMPEQQIVKHPPSPAATPQQHGDASSPANVRPVVAPQAINPEANRQVVRRDGPIAKPLPSSGKPDGDISWVG